MYLRLADVSNNGAEQWNNSKSGEEGRQLNREGKWIRETGGRWQRYRRGSCVINGAAEAFQMLKRKMNKRKNL